MDNFMILRITIESDFQTIREQMDEKNGYQISKATIIKLYLFWIIIFIIGISKITKRFEIVQKQIKDIK